MPAPTRTRGQPHPAAHRSRTRPARTSAGSPATARRTLPIAAAIALTLTIAATVTALVMGSGRGESGDATISRPAAPLAAGSKAPALDLTDAVTGKRYTLASAPGAVTLVSFLSTRPDTADTPSRSQAVALVSLATQYGARGLRVAIVDDSSAPAGNSALTNTVYDWQLGPVALLADPRHDAADRYGVTAPPTSYLVSASGNVLARWSGYVLTSSAAATITANLPAAPGS